MAANASSAPWLPMHQACELYSLADEKDDDFRFGLMQSLKYVFDDEELSSR